MVTWECVSCNSPVKTFPGCCPEDTVTNNDYFKIPVLRVSVYAATANQKKHQEISFIKVSEATALAKYSKCLQLNLLLSSWYSTICQVESLLRSQCFSFHPGGGCSLFLELKPTPDAVLSFLPRVPKPAALSEGLQMAWWASMVSFKEMSDSLQRRCDNTHINKRSACLYIMHHLGTANLIQQQGLS